MKKEKVATAETIRCAKLQSDNHHQRDNTILQAGRLSCYLTNSVKALKADIISVDKVT